jgi:ribonuclease R
MDYEIVKELLRNRKTPLKFNEILKDTGADKNSLSAALDEMVAAYALLRTKKGTYALPEQLGYVVGKMQRKERGFGFLIPDEGDEDVFIPASEMNGAFGGDRVMASFSHKSPKDKRREGMVLRILERGRTELVGTFDEIPSGGFLVPEDKSWGSDVFIPREKKKGAKSGDKVVVKITKYEAARGRNPIGEVTEVLGSSEDIGVDILCIIKEKGIPTEFDKSVIAEAEKAGNIAKSDLKDRLDLTGKVVVTIDGADAKDLDDAISIAKTPAGNHLLGVHIADVSNYVKPGTALDDEAYDRATSVYFVDRVIPMLPESISNGICSLSEGVLRLTMSCFMEIDARGKVISYDIRKSYIKSTARLTYDEVNDIFDGDKAATKKRKKIKSHLYEMKNLAETLTAARYRRGSLELDIDEAHIQVNEEGIPVSISPRARGISHRMIEEFMLAANETVARHVENMELPFMYRVHAQPDPEKLKEFLRFSHNLGYHIKGSSDDIRPKQLQEILDAANNQPEENVLNMVMLRTMQKAVYSSNNIGHFGLASKCYCHFTSPIRRYPDLIVHRVLKGIIDGNVLGGYIEQFGNRAAGIALHCSERERRAMLAERDVDDLKMTEYMSQHVGEVFDAVISGVTDFGIFAELPNTIEGLIRMTSLDDDYYVYEEQGYQLRGQRHGNVYKLGQKIKVRCINADIAMRNIDFEPAED